MTTTYLERRNKVFIDSQDADLFPNDPTAHLYELRCLPLASEGDVCIFSELPDAAILRYYKTVRPTLPRIYSPSDRRQDLASAMLADTLLLGTLREMMLTERWEIEPYSCSNTMLELSRRLGLEINMDTKVCQQYSSKVAFKKLAQHLCLPTPSSIVVSLPEDAHIVTNFVLQHNKTILKADVSTGGSGVRQMERMSAKDTLLDVQSVPRGRYLCEEFIKAQAEGSFHLIYCESGYRSKIAETFYEGFHYAGCSFPASAFICEKVKPLVERIRVYFDSH
jgi:hypothetical protein